MDILEKMRSLESDHDPDGWPAVTMGQVSALCDEIDRLRAQLEVVQGLVPVVSQPAQAEAIPDKQYDINLIHRAARHLEVVMDEHPYCDHVQVVKHFADIRLKERSISASPTTQQSNK